MSTSSNTVSPAVSSPTSSLGSKPAVLLIGGVTHVKKEWEECSSFAELKSFEGKTREEFLEKCKDGSYADVVAIYRSNESTSVSSLGGSAKLGKKC
jgi:glyoxylate reductase